MNEFIRIISDVHGKYKEYLKIVNSAPYSIQLGDFGFNYDCLKRLNPDKHVIILGNHENYDLVTDVPHCLGDYGKVELSTKEKDMLFFFIRGAPSLDGPHRVREEILTGVKSWWSQEEIPRGMWGHIIDEYMQLRPQVVLSHDVPLIVSKMLINKPMLHQFGWKDHVRFRTTELLQTLFNIHQPKLHIFAHYHTWFDEVINNTRFLCMPELGYMDVDCDWNIINSSRG